MTYSIRVRSEKRRQLLISLDRLIDAERAERAGDAWFHGALWVLLKLPPDQANYIASELLKLHPHRGKHLKKLLSDDFNPFETFPPIQRHLKENQSVDQPE